MKRIDALDAWRGIAIIGVLAFHYLVKFAPPFHAVDRYGYQADYPVWLDFGSYGVQLFFVISGMVITMTLLKSRDALDFAFRRFARLYPAFLVCMTFTFVYVSTLGPEFRQVSLFDYFANLTMVANRLGFSFVDGVYWSLVIEIQFYALVAISWAVLRERFWIALLVVGLLGAPVSAIHARAADALLLAQFMPFFLAGVAAWFWLFEKRKGAAAWLASAALGLYAFHSGNLTIGHQPSLWAPLLLLALIVAMIASVAWNVSVPLLPSLGRISYSLYLIHDNVGVHIIQALHGLPDLVRVGAAVTVSLILAAACYHYVEQPGGQWLNNLRLRIRPAVPA